MAKKDAPQDAGSTEAKPAGKLKLIILIVGALFLAVGLSVGGTWLFLNKGAAKDETETEAAAATAAPVKQWRSTKS